MKIDEAMRFPHPVLWTQTTDYSQGAFSVEITKIQESISSGHLKADCAVTVTAPEISALLKAGRASVGIFVTCMETYFNELFALPDSGGGIDVPGGQLRGQVMFRPIIWASDSIDDFQGATVHPEFGVAPFSFDKGAILALADVTQINVGSDKLAPMGTIFELSRDDTVPLNNIGVQSENDKIQILACDQTLEKIHLLRNTPEGRALLLNSVYLPVVMEVMSALRSDPEIYEGKRWHRVFSAKLDYLGVNVSSADLLDAAQKLLKSPFGKVDTILEVKV